MARHAVAPQLDPRIIFDRTDYRTAPPPAAMAAAIVVQIAAVLSDTHRVDIVHRDIKPANVMLVDGGLVKVLDFGMAIPRGSGALPRLTRSAYQAAHQVTASRDVRISARADVKTVVPKSAQRRFNCYCVNMNTQCGRRVADPIQLGRVLAAARRERGLTQQQLADRMYLDRTYLARMENGLATEQVRRTLIALRELGFELRVVNADA
jgi:serine/threonine protein kinase